MLRRSKLLLVFTSLFLWMAVFSPLVPVAEAQVGTQQTEFARDEQTCKSGSFNLVFRWILCPIVSHAFEGINFLYTKALLPILVFSPLSDNSAGSGINNTLFDVWNNFRVIANVLFVLVFLAATFGQAFAGFQIFSAYEIKKIIPRLVIGIIGVQLSWYIVAFMVDLFNIIGAGLRGLVLAPVNGVEFTVNFDFESAWYELIATIGITAAITGGLWVGGIAMGLPMILFPIITGLLLAFTTVLIRRALITILVVTAPIAFVAWILPNTAGMFRAWWSYFWKALLVYPIIVLLLASGELFAKIISEGNTAGDGTQRSVFNTLMAMMALFAPYFLIPFTFQFAGGALNLVAGSLDRRGKSANQKIFGDARDPESWRARRKTKQRRDRVKRKSRVMRTAERVQGNKLATDGKSRRTRALGKGARFLGGAAFGAGNLVGRKHADIESELQKNANQAMALQLANGERDYMHALISPDGRHMYEGSQVADGVDENGNPKTKFVGRELDPVAVQRAKKDSNDRHKVQAALNLVLEEAAYDEDKVRAISTRFAEGDPVDELQSSLAQETLESVAGVSTAAQKVSARVRGTTPGDPVVTPKLSGMPKVQEAYNSARAYRRQGATKPERLAMLNQAADFNNKYSPDYLYRDPSNGFRMHGDTQVQKRFLKRVNGRLTDNRSMNNLSASFWNGADEVMDNAERIYRKGAGVPDGALGPVPAGAFDPSRLDANELDLLREAKYMHDATTSSPGANTSGSTETNQARENFVGNSRKRMDRMPEIGSIL